MNYIVLINTFWSLRRSCKISNLQADLYFFLLQESNARNWQNPFHCSNQMICASLGVSEKSVIAARMVLKDLGLIDYENGITKRLAPKYCLLEYCNKVSNPVSNPVSNQGNNPVSNPVSIDGNILYKQKETKSNKTKQSSFNDVPSFDKKNISDDYWEKWVSSWFEFYQKKHNGIKPIFHGSQPKALKEIRSFLKKNAQENMPEKDPEEHALQSWQYILENHFRLDDWLKTQFDLSVILKKMNDIMSQLRGKKSNPSSIREELAERIEVMFASKK